MSDGPQQCPTLVSDASDYPAHQLIAFGSAANLIVCQRTQESAITVLETERGVRYVAFAQARRAPDGRMAGSFTPINANMARDLAAALLQAADFVDGGSGKQ